MEFRVEKNKLVQVLTQVQGITGKKTNIPITSNILITSEKDHLSIIATDLEIAFQGTYQAEILSEGSCAIPSRKFFEIVREFPSESLSVKELENKWIQIANDKLEYNIVAMETDDFPGLPNVEGAELFEIESETLKEMIEKTIFAVMTDEGRAHLAGVFFEIVSSGDEKMLRMVSTDGHRLSLIDHPIKKGKKFTLDAGVIIPKSGIVEVLKILETGKKIEIGIKENNFIVKKDSEGLIIRLIEGDFPDYDLVIPKMNKSELRVDKKSFMMMLKRMSILSSDKYRSIRCKMGKDQIETTTINPEIGESRETIPVDYGGEEIEMAFNARYFMDSITPMKSDEIILRLNDEATPCLLKGNDDPNFISVIMPMRV